MTAEELLAWRLRHGWSRPEAAQLLQVPSHSLLKRERGLVPIEPALALLCWLLDEDPALEERTKAHVGFTQRPYGRPRNIAACPHGHPWTTDNTYLLTDGHRRQCRACNARRERLRQQAARKPKKLATGTSRENL